MSAKVLVDCSPLGLDLVHKAGHIMSICCGGCSVFLLFIQSTGGLIQMPDEFWNASVEALYLDQQD